MRPTETRPGRTGARSIDVRWRPACARSCGSALLGPEARVHALLERVGCEVRASRSAPKTNSLSHAGGVTRLPPTSRAPPRRARATTRPSTLIVISVDQLPCGPAPSLLTFNLTNPDRIAHGSNLPPIDGLAKCCLDRLLTPIHVCLGVRDEQVRPVTLAWWRHSALTRPAAPQPLPAPSSGSLDRSGRSTDWSAAWARPGAEPIVRMREAFVTSDDTVSIPVHRRLVTCLVALQLVCGVLVVPSAARGALRAPVLRWVPSHVLASVTQSHAAVTAAISRGGRPQAR